MTDQHTEHTEHTEHYDLIIVGTGSGNSVLTPDFDDKKVAIVEEGTFGGTCLNVGCIPTKMFVLAADTALQAREAERLNVDLEYRGADWKAIQQRVFGDRVDQIAAGGSSGKRADRLPGQQPDPGLERPGLPRQLPLRGRQPAFDE